MPLMDCRANYASFSGVVAHMEQLHPAQRSKTTKKHFLVAAVESLFFFWQYIYN